ncbi:hypothetical protein MKW98_022689, partial [Papaver atlanticum]
MAKIIMEKNHHQKVEETLGRVESCWCLLIKGLGLFAFPKKKEKICDFEIQ